MNPLLLRNRRVLAVDPSSKGFGFTVLEGPDMLVEWGVRHASGDRNRKCVEKVVVLFNRYQPDVLVVEDTSAKGSLRRTRASELIQDLLAIASLRRLRVQRVARRKVQRYFAGGKPAMKRQVAVALTERFPELEICLPPVRKPWMREDDRMSIFDALAFAVTFFGSSGQRSEAITERSPVAVSTPLIDAK